MATGEKEVMWRVWQKHDHFCEVCEEQLLHFNPANCAHILNKNKYPLYRLNPDNIAILCLTCHAIYDQAPHKMDERFIHLLNKESKLKREYDNQNE